MLDYPQVNQYLGKYPLLSIIGKGATAWVYKSYHQVLKTYVAIKVLSPTLNQRNSEAKEIFFEEAINLTKMSHSGLIKIMDADTVNGFFYIVMEYIDGDSVESLINKKTYIEPLDAVKIILKVCNTLNYLSKFNLVHRDIKPANIMVDINQDVKLLDFGLSKFLNEPVKFNLIAGPMCGSLFYMSPEQLTDSDRVNFSADFYSIGATLYHMITGKVPFKTDNLSEIIAMHIGQTPIEPIKINNQIIPQLSYLVMRLLEKVPSKRYKDYNEIIQELEKIKLIYENKKNQVVADVILANQIAQAEHNLSSSHDSVDGDLQQKFFNTLRKTNSETNQPVKKINVPVIVTKKSDNTTESIIINQDDSDFSEPLGLVEKFLTNFTDPNVSSKISDEIKSSNNSEQNNDSSLSDLQKKFLKNISSL